MSVTDVMGGLDAFGQLARKFKHTLAEDDEVAAEFKAEFGQFADFIETHSRKCEAALTEDLISEEDGE